MCHCIRLEVKRNGHFRVILYLFFKASLGLEHSLSCENESDSNADKIHFHMKGYAPGLAFKRRHKTTRKWAIVLCLPRDQGFIDLFVSVVIGHSRYCGIRFG